MSRLSTEPSERIDLAHAANFQLGPLVVRPATREVIRDDDAREVIEPRVMQVFVALARANGAILSRDDLTRCCWEDRIVGEDAINRVISRLRRVAEGIGGDGFRIETITKVGYRLVRNGDVALASVTPPADPIAVAEKAEPLSRRVLIGGGLVIAALAAAGVALHRRAASPIAPAIPADVAPLIEQARLAAGQEDTQGRSQAIGLLRRVVEMRPDYADGWGILALTYSSAVHIGAAKDSAAMADRTRGAAAKAMAIEPGNAYARVALGGMQPRVGHWLEHDRIVGQALKEHPADATLMRILAANSWSTGRPRETARLLDKVVALAPPSPAILYSHCHALWAANRLEEADRALDVAYALYPLHYAVWFTRFYVLMYTGRAAEAIAMADDRDARPPNIPDEEFEAIVAAARAMISHSEEDVDTAMRLNLAAAHTGAGHAENAMQFAAALGRIDTAFAIAEAYFFNRGFTVADLRFAKDSGAYTRRADRRTYILFLPSTRAMRRDSRFEPLVREIGLARYWAQSGNLPDYKTGGDG